MASVTVSKYLPEVLVLSGLPGSGKTTAALRWVEKEPTKRVRVNYDDLRREMYGPDWKFNRKEEDLMQARARDIASNALKLGMSVVVDNTNLTPKARQPWVDLAKQFNAHHEVQEIDTPIWECIHRDSEREGNARVGRAVIERMALFNGWIDWKDRQAYRTDGFVICDLDGTLANISHRRHLVQGDKKDWPGFFSRVSDDKLNEKVADLLEMFEDDGLGILLVSGRPLDICGKATEDWLYKCGIRFDHLFMRAGRDSRPDTIVKKEILDLLPKDRIEYVIDDRASVCEMWRNEGLFCLQVAKGEF